MSILKKNALAAALVAGLGIAGVAGAYTTLTSGNDDPEMVATADAADDLVTMTEAVEVSVDPEDFIVGRTTGFQVRLNLDNATYFATPTITAGADLPTGWTAEVAAGGAGSAYLVVNVFPPETDPTGIVPGDLFSIPGIALEDVGALTTEGGKITAQSFFVDPVGADEIDGSRVNVDLLEAGNPIVLECDAEDGDTSKRIDVADLSDQGGPEAKTQFSPDGVLGEPYDDWFNFGSLSASVDDGFGTFTYEGTDEFTTVLTGDASSNFDAFDSIFLSDTPWCDDGALVEGEIDGNTVTFEYTLDDVGGDADGYNVWVCGEVDGETVIDDVNPISSSTTFERPETTLTRTLNACPLLPLQYNGSVIEVFHINPASNATAKTFMRVINRSTTGGMVHIEGIDDAGVSHGEVHVMVGAGESVQLNSDDLENGNAGKGITGAWGDGDGKWRAIVTAEFGGARVQALSRNATDGTITNLTDADGQGEQVVTGFFDNGGFFLF